jgi:hypothetical protein
MAGWQVLRLYVLRLYVAPISTTLILLGINLVIAALFGALASRSSPGRAEREALRVRRQVASTLLRLGRRRGQPRRSVFRLLR